MTRDTLLRWCTEEEKLRALSRGLDAFVIGCAVLAAVLIGVLIAFPPERPPRDAASGGV